MQLQALANLQNPGQSQLVQRNLFMTDTRAKVSVILKKNFEAIGSLQFYKCYVVQVGKQSIYLAVALS